VWNSAVAIGRSNSDHHSSRYLLSLDSRENTFARNVLRISRLIQDRSFKMSIWTIILIILVIALLGGFSGIGGGPFYGTGYYGGGGLGLVIIILLILLLLGKL
jgi:Protein of unknown function (DUF3309)